MSACGGGSDKEPATPVNKAPIVSMASTLTINSGASITLSTTVSDPEGDAVSLTWQADNANVSFATPNESSTLVTFPETNIDVMVIITLVATDSQGKSSQKSTAANLKAITSVNQAPVISLSAEQQTQGGQTIVLIATAQDPQDDSFSVEWHAENTDITFSDNNSLTTSLTLPVVVNELTTTITLTATDDHNNQSEKTLQLTILPKDKEPEPTVNIELLDRFEIISGDVASISARLTSNVEIDSINWDLSSINSTNKSQEDITQYPVTTSEITFTAPIVEKLTEFPISIVVTTIDNLSFSSESRITVAADSTKSLSITLPENSVINESSGISITPTIESSHAIDSYQWRWLSDQELTLLTPSSKILNVLAPAVEADIQGQLELTVVMAGLSKTVTTELIIKNKVTYSDINVWATKLIAVKGQKVRLNVETDNFEQIKSWSWEVSGVEGTNINKSNQHFEITAPQVSGQQTMSIIYRATLFDDSEILEIANITVLSESIARSSFTFSLVTTPRIHNDTEQAFIITFADPHALVDSAALDLALTFNTFDKVELTRNSAGFLIVLKTNTVVFDHPDFISLALVYGDFKHQYPIQLQMLAN